jgi:tRNA(Ile)-lysidine synthase
MGALRRPPAVARVLQRVTATVRQHEMLGEHDHVLVWVSGGPDSVCLLYSLWYLRRLFRIRVSVFHLDHGLRADSAADAAYVGRLAKRLKVACYVRKAEPLPAQPGSVEMWARFQRVRAAGELADEIGATRCADGHTLDDQAESVLMGLVLGWGLEGLAGIAPVNGRLVRPLLEVTREEVEAFCGALHLRPRLDPTNQETSYLRNAIRLEALPAIERATGREVRQTFARTASLLRRDALALSELVDEHARSILRIERGGVRLRAQSLRELPPALASRVVRRSFQLTDLRWDREAIEAVLDLAAGRPGRRRDLFDGLKAWRDREYVHVSRSSIQGEERQRGGK